MTDKKEKILKILKEEKTGFATSKIAYEIGSNQYQTTDWLEELEGDNKVERFIVGKGTYWRIKKK